jgi:hypothetical protein
MQRWMMEHLTIVNALFRRNAVKVIARWLGIAPTTARDLVYRPGSENARRRLLEVLRAECARQERELPALRRRINALLGEGDALAEDSRNGIARDLPRDRVGAGRVGGVV